jgi:cytoskeletal protein RodZ
MGTIGNRLREERERRGIGIEEVEAHTKIRARYLLALEDERFADLPDPAYARAFVRDYADELGMDSQSLLDEMGEPEPELPREVVSDFPPESLSRVRTLVPTRWLLVAALAIAIVAAMIWAGSRLGSGSGRDAASVGSSNQVAQSGSSGGSSPPPTSTAPPPSTTTGTAALPIAFTTSAGPCWLEVRAGSATGAILFQGTLATNKTLHFSRQRVWARVGAPWNLRVHVGSQRFVLPIAQTGDLVVTHSGAAAAA